MTPHQRLMYRCLLQACFEETTRPNLPDDDDRLWKLANADSKKQWDKNKSVIKSKFDVIEVKGISLLRHKRVEADWNRLLEKRLALIEGGRSGGLARASKAQARLKPALSEAQATLKQVSKVSKRSEVSEEKGSEEMPAPITKVSD